MSEMKVDFVIPWVDGDESKWKKSFNEQFQSHNGVDANLSRYRDWELLKFWFRGVELNAPWVNKIYFITCGHLPKWLNVNHPKIVIVKHEDYIPSEYLPVFSSHPIELNMHRISGLSETFIYFNDDFFITSQVSVSDFFKDGKPLDLPMLRVNNEGDTLFGNVLDNNMILIKSKYSVFKVILNSMRYWWHVKVPLRDIYHTLVGIFTTKNVIFKYHHLPQPLLKTTLFKAWDDFGEKLVVVSSNKFRDKIDVNQYVFKYIQYCLGHYSPINVSKLGTSISLSDSNFDLVEEIIDSSKVVCLNDNDNITDFELVKSKIYEKFENLYPDKSKFEI